VLSQITFSVGVAVSVFAWRQQQQALAALRLLLWLLMLLLLLSLLSSLRPLSPPPKKLLMPDGFSCRGIVETCEGAWRATTRLCSNKQ